jgi:hypothetical protein
MVKVLSKYIEAIKLGAQIDVKAPPGGTAAGKLVLLPTYETEQVFGLGASSTSQTIFVCDTVSGSFQIAAVSVSFGTASTSGTLQVEVATGTQAVGSGTNQLSSTVSLSGTANTTVNGVIVATPTTIAAGNRINIILAGTLTSLANACVTLILQRVS